MESLNQTLSSYQQWRETLAETVTNFHHWLTDNQLIQAEQELRLFDAVDTLKKDQLTIAFVAEFSRGKTELINALFFAEYGRRLLPSEAGRTTMCPTELLYDRDSNDSYIMLLPIETRASDRSIAQFKHDPVEWSRIRLDTESADQMSQAMNEVVRTDQVPLEKAKNLGFYHQESDPYFQKHGKPPETVEIPHWRHAVISFPHDLLKNGLVVLDTPGLNALGNEPELTINTLPSAQAVLFLLAADTGVTRSDLDIWEHYISSIRKNNVDSCTVVLNKIDTLWDDLKTPDEINASIQRQCQSTAEQLDVPTDTIFPLSAQKALVGKIHKNDELLTASRLPELEAFLSNTIIPARQTIVKNNLIEHIGPMITEQITIQKTQEQDTREQLTELVSIRGKNADVIMHLVNKTQQEQDIYLEHVQIYQGSRRLLQAQGNRLLNTMNIDIIDRLINNTRNEMKNSWTTVGLKRGMESFFDGTHDAMEQTSRQADKTFQLIESTYRKFHEEHGLPELKPKYFNSSAYTTELERLYQEADNFRRSPMTVMAEQQFVIKKFFISLVSHTRNLFYKAEQDAELWLKEVMNPLIQQIKEHKINMEKRLDTLKRISHSRETIDERINQLEIHCSETAKKILLLEKMRGSLTTGSDFSVQKPAQTSPRTANSTAAETA
ncbi:MAG: dynamin family protein [Gammaproteobacteria bacterium]